MKTILNLSAVLIVPFLSIVFFASTARADGSWSDKNKQSEHASSARHDQPKQHPSSVQKRTDQVVHRDQGTLRNHDRDIQHARGNLNFRDHPFYSPAPIISYANYIPVVYNAAPPSIGAFVDGLPAGYLTVVINDETYAVYQGVFYKRTFSGYEVVDPTTLIDNGPFTISILNNDGGYTQIQMDVGNNGFIGPQGEFYAQFPSIQQLQTMYVR